MKPARVVFPGFWFGKSDYKQAEELAKRGVGGFCLYGGTAQEILDFTKRMQVLSPYDKILFCADIDNDLSEIVKDAPVLPANSALSEFDHCRDISYRKGNLMARMARSIGIDWVLVPVIDLGYTPSSFSDSPMEVANLVGDFVAGLANGGVLNCVKYFPGVSGALKTLAQMEDSEFLPYKHVFRRADSIMLSDMIFPNLDDKYQAMQSEIIIKDILKKRLNYKGCIISFPFFRAHIRAEEACALRMLQCGVEIILSPKQPEEVIEVVEKSMEKDKLMDKIIQSVSSQEIFISKARSGPEPDKYQDVFALVDKFFKK